MLLFGYLPQDDFSRSIVPNKDRPAIKSKYEQLKAMHPLPRKVNIEIQDEARIKARGMRPHTTFKKRGSAIAGPTSCGRDAAFGW
jgi:hypothetical protein